jgi:hypothetical protein
MNEATIACESWPLRRWSICVLLVLAIQVGSIFWFSERPLSHSAPPPAQTSLRYLERPSVEWLSLLDPTLFALPNRQNFSGLAWLRIPRQELPVIEWSEPTNWLALSTANLGKTWGHSGPRGASFIPQNAMETEPLMKIPVPEALPFPSESVFHLQESPGQKITLLQPLKLRSWPSAEILSNTVVSAMVDAEGIPNSAALLARCGSPDADRYAVDQVSQARFSAKTGATSVPGPLGGLRWVTIVFEWRTELAAATNTPTATAVP